MSLLELVLTLAIVVVMAAIAIPRYGSAAGRYRLDLAARRIVADLAYTQGLAARNSSPQRLVFDPVNDTYTLEGAADLDRPGQDYGVDLAGTEYGVDLVSAAFQNSNAYVSTDVTFNLWGRPQCGNPPADPMVPLASGSIVVQVGSQTRTITIDPTTGKAGIQ